MKDNKINGYNKNKAMTKFERKITPIDDDGAKMDCSLANSLLVHESQQSTVKVMSHRCQSQTISQINSRCFFHVVLNLSELESCLILLGKLFHKKW